MWLGLGLLVYGVRDRGGEEEEEEEGVSCISSRVVPPCYFLVLLFFSRSSLFLSVFFFLPSFLGSPPLSSSRLLPLASLSSRACLRTRDTRLE